MAARSPGNNPDEFPIGTPFFEVGFGENSRVTSIESWMYKGRDSCSSCGLQYEFVKTPLDDPDDEDGQDRQKLESLWCFNWKHALETFHTLKGLTNLLYVTEHLGILKQDFGIPLYSTIEVAGARANFGFPSELEAATDNPHLRVVRLGFEPCENDIQLLAKIDRLTEVRIDLPSSSSNVLDLEPLLRLQHLRKLRLSGKGVNDRVCSAMSKMTLEQVVLEHTRVTDKGLQRLASCGSIRHFDCNHAVIGDAGVGPICADNPIKTLKVVNTNVKFGEERNWNSLLREVGSLDISLTNVHEQSNFKLSELKSLESLSVRGLIRFGKLAKELEQLGSLEYLAIKNCDISAACLESFHSLHPQCFINPR